MSSSLVCSSLFKILIEVTFIFEKKILLLIIINILIIFICKKIRSGQLYRVF